MSDRDLLAQLSGVLARLYHTTVDSLSSEEERAAMLTQLGLQVPHGPPPDAASARQAIDRLQAKADENPENSAELSDLLALLASSSLALHALLEDVQAANDGTDVATMVAAYLELMCAITVRLRRPTSYAMLQGLRLIDDQELHFERLPELLSAAGDIQRGGEAVAEEAEVDLASIALGGLAMYLLFRVHEPLDQSFARKVLFGIDLDPATTHPHAQAILNRTVTFNFDWHTPEGTEGVEGGGGFIGTLVLVPPHHGGPGCFASLGGEGELVVPLLEGQVELKITANVLGGMTAFFGFGDAAATSFGEIAATHGAAPPDAGIEVALERALDAVQAESPARLGGKDALHLELRSFTASGTLGSRSTGALVTVEKGALVIPKDAAGSIVGALLPSGGTRLEASFTLGWDTERHFYLEGGAGLKATRPLNAGGKGLHADATLTIELVAKTDDPARLDVLLYGAFSLRSGSSFQITVDRLGYQIGAAFPNDASGPAMGNHVASSTLWPTGIGAELDLHGLKGGGFLLLDQARGEYGGVLELSFTVGGRAVVFKAFGLLSERPGGWSFIVVLSFQFDPGLYLGSFVLHGLGGIVAINHTIDVEAMRLGLRDGALDKLLFPANPVADAPAILQTLRTVFPVSDGRVLVGPMFEIGIGAPLEYLTAAVALVVVAPSPYLIALLGRLRVALPHPDEPLVDLRADFFGVFDLGTGAVSIDASLVKSRIGWYPVEGDLALRSGGDWFFSAGGFHPHFPLPASAPQLRRLRLDVSASAAVRLRFEAYLAVTSNTVQLGGRGELTVSVGSFGVYGFIGVDALVHTDTPVKFSVHVAVTLELRYGGSVLASLQADLLVEGAGPWHVKGRVSMSILFWDISVPFDETWSQFQAEVAAADLDVLEKVRAAVADPRGWASVLPTATDAFVSFRSVERTALAVHPLGRLTIRQAVAPLGVTVTRVGPVRPAGGPTAVYIGSAALTTGIAPVQAPVTGQFARAQYFDLSDDQKLSAPSYEPLQDGIELGADAVRSGRARRTDVAYETILVGAVAPKRRATLDLSHLRWSVPSGAVARSGLHDARVNAGPDQSVRLADSESLVVDTSTMLPATDVLAAAGTLSVAEQALGAFASTDPARARELQVVGAHEAAG